MKAHRLSEPEIAAAIAQLPGWNYEQGKLHRVFTCRDFVHAWGFMSSVALVAEAMNHHPEWSNVWNRVSVNLVTHDAGGVTSNDIELASRMSKIFGS